jgi:hypothetical protein
MRRNEWLIVFALLALTLVTVAFAPPTQLALPAKTALPSQPGESDTAQVTITPASQATAAVTSAPTAEPSPIADPTLTLAATPKSPAPTASSAPSVTAGAPSATSVTSAPSAPSATPMPSLTPSATPTVIPTPYPFDTRADLARFVYIDQRVQHMYVFEQGVLVRDIPCSTGLPNDNTYTEAWSGAVGEYWGTFFSYGTYQDDGWYLYKSLGSILVHSLPYTEVDGVKVYQGREFLGVRPSSHGCIRISPEDARWFTAWNPQGVYMVITDPYRELWQ